MPAVTVTTTPTLLVDAKGASLRSWVLLEVAAGGSRVYVSPRADVTPATGFALEPTIATASSLFASGRPSETAWYGIVSSGSQAVKIGEGAGAGASRGNNDLISIFRPPLSAYDLAVQEGYSGTLDEWLASLQGEGASLPSNVLLGVVDNDQTMVTVTNRDGDPLAQVPYVP